MAKRWTLTSAVGVLAMQALPASAAPTLEQCRSLQDAQARLACYDGITVPVTDSPGARAEEQKRNFGLTERRKAPVERAEAEEIKATISNIRAGSSGPILELDNGNAWQVTTNGNLQNYLAAGQVVTIKRGMLSGYRLRADGVIGMETVRRIQ